MTEQTDPNPPADEKVEEPKTRLIRDRLEEVQVGDYVSARNVRDGLLKLDTILGKKVDKVKVFARPSGKFDIVAYGTQREIPVK